MKEDVYTRVTNQIISSLEQGVRPWTKPWDASHTDGRIVRPLRGNGVPYQGINILMLWSAAFENGFAAPTWLTFKQAQELGANVRKGKKGTLVVFASTMKRNDTDEATSEDIEREIPFLKSYTVFNVEQIDGLPDRFQASAAPRLNPIQRIEQAEQFVAATGATVHHGGNRAFYTPTYDYVQMPLIEAFRDAESYYSTLAHELTHWTGHKSRLERTFGQKRFGDAGYAMEELVAELGAAFLAASLDITPEPRADHAAYIDHWLTVLKGDKRAIFTAASYAQRAADFLMAKPG